MASFTIPPEGHVARFINDPQFKTFSGSTFHGTLSFRSNVPVGVTALRSLINERGDFLMSTLPVVDMASSTSREPVTVPHFADGGGWSTEILLLNPTDNVLTGRIEFRNDAGEILDLNLGEYGIAPRSSVRLSTPGTSPSAVAGSVRIIPDGVAPVSQVVFAYRTGGVTVSHAGVPTASGTAFRTYVETIGAAGTPGNILTGLAVANNSAASVRVTLELMRLDGTSTGLQAFLDLPAFGHTSRFVEQFFPNGLAETYRGILRIYSDSTAISVALLRCRYNENGDFLITVLPASDEASPPTASELIFPQVPDGGGYTTQFILFNGSTAQTSSGALTFTTIPPK